MTTFVRSQIIFAARSAAVLCVLAQGCVGSEASLSGVEPPPQPTEATGLAGMAGTLVTDDDVPADDVDPRDMAAFGHDLVEEADLMAQWDGTTDVSVVAREMLPSEVLADLERLERDAFVDKAIVGADNRVAVSNTKVDPYKTVVRLFVQYAAGGKTRGCTGTLIAPDAVLTAAHCVFNSSRATPGYAYAITVVPGLHPKNPLPTSGVRYEAPFGTASGRKIFVPARYIDHEANTWNRIPHDYAVVRLKRSFGAVGTKRFGAMTSPLGKVARLIGYHGDKTSGLRMCSSRDQVRKVSSNGTFNHYMDTDHGASGSGITGGGGWEDRIFGVNSSQVAGATPYNIAATITSSTQKVIADWAVRPL